MSRVKTMLSSSPLGRRRHVSSGSIASVTATELLSAQNGLIWGVSLDKLVAQNKSKQHVPFIVEKIVGHVEKYGMPQLPCNHCCIMNTTNDIIVVRVVSGRTI